MPTDAPQTPVVPHLPAPRSGLSVEQFEARGAETRAAWPKLNPEKAFPDALFDALWLQLRPPYDNTGTSHPNHVGTAPESLLVSLQKKQADLQAEIAELQKENPRAPQDK